MIDFFHLLSLSGMELAQTLPIKNLKITCISFAVLVFISNIMGIQVELISCGNAQSEGVSPAFINNECLLNGASNGL